MTDQSHLKKLREGVNVAQRPSKGGEPSLKHIEMIDVYFF
jgi:hypothetical protein